MQVRMENLLGELTANIVATMEKPENDAFLEDDVRANTRRCDTQAPNTKVAPIKVYDSAALLEGLTFSPCQSDNILANLLEADEHISTLEPVLPQVYTISSKMMCSVCAGCQFDSREQQVEHYKLDWHRFNLKQRIMGNDPVTMETFEEMSGDISSISGSESDNISDVDGEDLMTPYSDTAMTDTIQSSKVSAPESQNIANKDSATRNHRIHPRVFFNNSQGQLISVYRCILHGKKNIPSSQSELISMATKLAVDHQWAIIMTGGGHFAAAVFNGGKILAHKTFHRYTVRAKRGAAQGTRDSQQGGKQPRSAGASLRRYNEAALMKDIQDLLDSWKNILSTCHRIFLRAPSYNQSIFYGGKNPPFNRLDVRISTIPFPTRRATLKELHRIHEILSTIECHAEEATTHMMSSTNTSANHMTQMSVVTKTTKSPTKQETDGLDHIPVTVNESSDDDVDIDLAYEETETSTLHLKQFDSTKKTRRKKKRSQQHENILGRGKLTSDLYTACKTGNTDKLKTLLDEIAANALTESTCQEIRCESSSANFNRLPTQTSEFENYDNNGRTEELSQVFTDAHITDVMGNESKAEDNVIPCKNCTSDSETIIKNDDDPVRTENSHVEITAGNKCHDVLQTCEHVSCVLNNAIDSKGTTLLHVAAEAGHVSVLWLLMQSGANPSLKNQKGHPPYVLSGNKETRNEFRRFLAAHPDRYDYTTAQIPSPLTEDMEEKRSRKVTEKKKAQKKAKRVKQKEQKEEQKKKDVEQKEKQQFAALSDREKRALAAESRLAKQLTATEISNSRCWCCGESMADKMRFEYLDFKFCSMKCLKKRKLQQLNT